MAVGSEMEADIDDLPKNPANYMALTPLWFLDRAALVHPNRLSVVHGPKRFTWSETYQRCRRLASALAARSIGPGCTVTLSLSLFLSLILVFSVFLSPVMIAYRTV